MASLFSKRAASIGYGKRFGDLVKKTTVPGPQRYMLPSMKDNKSFSFGVSRDKYERVRKGI